MACKGDPLLFGVEISALPILRGTVLPELAKVLGMTRENAARFTAIGSGFRKANLRS
jgi:hypothetical protein